MTLLPTEDDISQVVEGIWLHQAGLELSRVPLATEIDGGGEVLTGCVQITGTWEGAVVLECSASLARRAAGAMFDVAPEAAPPADVQDALGELTNIAGGNLKALLPSPSRLALPVVTQGREGGVRVLYSRVVGQVAFRCAVGALRVTLRQRVGTEATTA